MRYNLVAKVESESVTLTGSFGDPAPNTEIVSEVVETLKTIPELAGGKVLKVTGPMSVPVAFAVAHAVLHRFGAVACFDPKLGGSSWRPATIPPTSWVRSCPDQSRVPALPLHDHERSR